MPDLRSLVDRFSSRGVRAQPNIGAWESGYLGQYFDGAAQVRNGLGAGRDILGAIAGQIRATGRGIQHITSGEYSIGQRGHVHGDYEGRGPGDHNDEPDQQHGDSRHVGPAQQGNRDPRRQYGPDGQPLDRVPGGTSFYRQQGQGLVSQAPQQSGDRDPRRRYGADGQPLDRVPEGATFHRLNNQSGQQAGPGVYDPTRFSWENGATGDVVNTTPQLSEQISAPAQIGPLSDALSPSERTRILNTTLPGQAAPAQVDAVSATDAGSPVADTAAPAATESNGITLPANGARVTTQLAQQMENGGYRFTNVGQGANAVGVWMKDGKVAGGYQAGAAGQDGGNFVSLDNLQASLTASGSNMTIAQLEETANQFATARTEMAATAPSPTERAYAPVVTPPTTSV